MITDCTAAINWMEKPKTMLTAPPLLARPAKREVKASPFVPACSSG
jgi:hypothetical protein